MDKTAILLIGGGGHCLSCIDVIESTGLYDIVGIVEAENSTPDNLTPYEIVGFDVDLPQLLQQTSHCLITIGQLKSAKIRQRLFAELQAMNAVLPTIISPLAYVSATAKIGEGTIIMHQSMVNAYAQIGDNCIINSKALVEHDSVIANHCHISTNVVLNGEVFIGEGCLVGSGTIIKQSVELVDKVIVGAASLVLSNINVAGVYKGIVK